MRATALRRTSSLTDVEAQPDARSSPSVVGRDDLDMGAKLSPGCHGAGGRLRDGPQPARRPTSRNPCTGQMVHVPCRPGFVKWELRFTLRLRRAGEYRSGGREDARRTALGLRPMHGIRWRRREPGGTVPQAGDGHDGAPERAGSVAATGGIMGVIAAEARMGSARPTPPASPARVRRTGRARPGLRPPPGPGHPARRRRAAHRPGLARLAAVGRHRPPAQRHHQRRRPTPGARRRCPGPRPLHCVGYVELGAALFGGRDAGAAIELITGQPVSGGVHTALTLCGEPHLDAPTTGMWACSSSGRSPRSSPPWPASLPRGGGRRRRAPGPAGRCRGRARPVAGRLPTAGARTLARAWCRSATTRS